MSRRDINNTAKAGLSTGGEEDCFLQSDLLVQFDTHEIRNAGKVTFATYKNRSDEIFNRVRRPTALLDPSCEYVLARLAPGDELVDVGANIGIFALPAARKGCRTLAVEALPSNFALLTTAIRTNELANIFPVNAAAWYRSTTVLVAGSGAGGTVQSEGQRVPAVRLDDLVPLHNFNRIAVIKLDIEGSELYALWGLTETLRRFPDVELVFEVNEPACRSAGYSGFQLLQNVESLGLKIFWIFGHKLVEQLSSGPRYVYCSDFIATRSNDFEPPTGFSVGALTAEEKSALILSQIESPHLVCRRYIAEFLSKSPSGAACRNDPIVESAFEMLRFDPERSVREAAESRVEVVYTKADSAAPHTKPDPVPNSTGRKPTKIALVGSQATFCGISSYINHLARLLQPSLEVFCVPLEQRIMRDFSPEGRRIANATVASLSAVLNEAGWINIHWEPGTFGSTPSDIVKRFKQIVRARRPLIMTFHSIGHPEPDEKLMRLAGLSPGRIGKAMTRWAHRHQKLNLVWNTFFKLLKAHEKEFRVAMIAHTSFDAYTLRKLGFKEVYDHPLCYMSAEERSRRTEKTRIQRNDNGRVDRQVRIGLFGFIGIYKGVSAAVEMMRHLPREFSLSIFGSIHPIVDLKTKECDPYLQLIIARIEEEEIAERIEFQESLDDDRFLDAIQSVDIVLCPYLEVGQSASGPAKMAIELGKPLICTRTEAFLELGKYYPNRIRFADIGNYLQMALQVQSIAKELESHGPNAGPFNRYSQYSAETLVALYERIVEGSTKASVGSMPN